MSRYYSFLLHTHLNYSTTTSSADAAAATSTQMPPTNAAATDPVESNYAVPQHLKHAGPPARQKLPPPPPSSSSTQTSPAAAGGHQQQQQQQHHKQQHHKQQQHQPQPTQYDAATRTAVPPPLPPLDLLDFIRQHLLRGKKAFHYRPWQFRRLAELAIASFSKQPTLLEIQGPVNVCGDIHGQYSDLLRIFHACGPPHKTRFLFLGDYVDRGNHSLEVICLLLAYKIQFPEHVFLLRGNHELIHINRIYGFHEEVRLRFSHPPKGGEDNAAAAAVEPSAEAEALFNLFNQVFAYMPLAATIGGKILCMHGGISPQLRSLDDIRQIQRPIPTVTEAGLVQDLLWSDPHTDVQAPGFPPNPQRCCSVLFGEEALKETLARLNIQLVMRAHQVVRYGYQEYAGGKLVTIFSAPRYNTELQNWAAVAKVSAELKVSFVLLKPTVQDERTVPIKDDGTDTQQSC